MSQMNHVITLISRMRTNDSQINLKQKKPSNTDFQNQPPFNKLLNLIHNSMSR